MIFILSIAYSPKVNPASMQQLNGLLFDECRRNGMYIVMVCTYVYAGEKICR